MRSKLRILFTPVIVTLILYLFGYNSGLDIFYSNKDSGAQSCLGYFTCQLKNLDGGVNALVADDVMITLSVAKRFLSRQNTNFNEGDSAQAATSYLLPIISSPLFLLPDLYAVLLFSFFGFMSVYLIWMLIGKGEDLKTKFDLVFVVFINTTIATYMLTGWEHVHQALLIILAWYLTVYKEGGKYYILIGVLSALAVLMRIDSIFLIGSLYLYILSSRNWSKFFYAFLAGLAIGLTYLYYQLTWFDYFTPTTARLKIGNPIDIEYNFKYFINMIVGGGCFIYIGYFLASLIRKGQLHRSTLFIIGGAVANIIYAFVVSDVFQHGRMYIATFLLLLFAYTSLEKMKVNKAVIYITVLLSFFSSDFDLLKHQVITQTSYSPTEAQYLLSRDISNNLSPDDGAVGLFYLGAMSFALPFFDIADFLGKADEDIAQLNAIKGQPIGHNKFNPAKTIDKWNVAVVPFPVDLAEADLDITLDAINLQKPYYFWHQTKLELLSRGFVFCVTSKKLDWGIYVRKDLVDRFDECTS